MWILGLKGWTNFADFTQGVSTEFRNQCFWKQQPLFRHEQRLPPVCRCVGLLHAIVFVAPPIRIGLEHILSVSRTGRIETRETRELESSKAAFTIAFFRYRQSKLRSQETTLETRPLNTETQNESKSTNHRSETMTFWTSLSNVLCS